MTHGPIVVAAVMILFRTMDGAATTCDGDYVAKTGTLTMWDRTLLLVRLDFG